MHEHSQCDHAVLVTGFQVCMDKLPLQNRIWPEVQNYNDHGRRGLTLSPILHGNEWIDEKWNGKRMHINWPVLYDQHPCHSMAVIEQNNFE